MGVNFDEFLSLVALCIVVPQKFQKIKGQKGHNKIHYIHLATSILSKNIVHQVFIYLAAWCNFISIRQISSVYKFEI
jgi:hypothetical protein